METRTAERASAGEAVRGAAPAAGGGHGRLTFVELGRGLAALAVVLFHANGAARLFGGPQWHWPLVGEHGVDFFFVLSGFIIFAAHHRDIGVPGKGRPYARKRIIRLLPLLWAVVLGLAAARWLAGVEVSAAQVARSLTLWPSLAAPAPLVVWTLRHEALFYMAFGLLIVRPVWGRALFAVWGMAAIGQALLVAAGRPVTGVASLFLSAYTLDFLLGAAVASLHRRGRLPTGRWVLPAALALVAAASAVELWAPAHRSGPTDYVSPGGTAWTLVLGLCFAAVLVGLLAAELRRTAPGWAVRLGAASYAIYLVHTPMNSLSQRVAVHLPQPVLAAGGGLLLLTVAGVAAGMVVHLFIEKPLTDALRRRWLGARDGMVRPALHR